MSADQAHKKIVIILRHEKSVAVASDYITQNNLGEPVGIILDRIVRANDAPAALKSIADLCTDPAVQAVIVGTKVYDDTVDDARDFPKFLDYLKASGLPIHIPVITTHLSEYTADARQALQNHNDLNMILVQNDNLGRDGMNNLGPVLVKALNHRQ